MSNPDYYAVLGLSKDASAKDIKKAYRDLALKHHPDRVDPSEKDKAQKKFQEIGEAYEILSDPEKRKAYDERGSMPAGFDFGGGGGGDFRGGGAQSFHFSNANDIFSQFFGTSDPFSAGSRGGGFDGMDDIFMNMGGSGIRMGGMGGPAGAAMGGARPPQQKGKEVHHTLFVTLREVYMGVTKKMRITKKVLDRSGRSTQVQ